jgi:RNA polymerase sigma factor (sigma-70 family)
MSSLNTCSELTDDTILQGVRGGDRKIFTAWYRSVYPELWKYAYRYVLSRDAAKDVVQDVFLNIWINRESWTVPGTLRAYLYKAVRNQALYKLRHENLIEKTSGTFAQNSLPLAMAVPSASPDEMAEHKELLECLESAVRSLPPRQREAVILRWHNEFNFTEIGRIMGIADTVARRILLRAQKTLRELCKVSEE